MNHNMLVDFLPETVEIEGTEYEIETNFRTFILFEMMMQDPELSDAEKARQGLELYIRRFRRTWMQQWIACCGSMPVVNDGVRREPVR